VHTTHFISQINKALITGSSVGSEMIYMARRFTEAEKQAALADLKDGMTLEQASKKHKCSSASLMQWKKAVGRGSKVAVKRTGAKVASSEAVPSMQADRVLELEGENKHLQDENRSLRSLMLDGYIANEEHPKLRRIAQTLRDAGKNQLQRILEIILIAEAEPSANSDSSDGRESTAESHASNGLPRHPSGTIKLRRKADIEA
jgi:transposase-like protein